jgi:hypothetical protein
MPFCFSCGKAISDNQKFCEYCGTAQDISDGEAPSPGQQQPPPPPPLQATGGQSPVPFAKRSPLPGNRVIVSGIIVLVIVAVGAYFIGMPLAKTVLPPSIQPTLPPVPSAVMTTVITPSPPQRSMVPETTVPTPKITRDDRFEETYLELYNRNLTYKFGQKEMFPVDLTQPPLFIKFNVIPVMVNRSKLVDIGLSTEHTVYAVYPDPNSWFEVKVLDAVSGTVVNSQGFNKEYNQYIKQEFMVREKGKYTVEMSGNGVTVTTQILTGD